MRIRFLLTLLLAVVLCASCRETPRGRTLEDWGRTPIEATLTPVGSFETTYKLVLRVRNSWNKTVRVKRISLLQVGRRSSGTTACQRLEDAAHVNWKLRPGETRSMELDLNAIPFEALDGSPDVAWKFVSAIPASEREISVHVLHVSSMWPGGMDESVMYP